MVDLRARHAACAPEVEAAILEVVRGGRAFDEAWIARAEAAACGVFGRAGAVGVGSGTDALFLALLAVGVRADDEVVVPALTFFATAGAVCAVGARPVVVDVGWDGLLDPSAALAAIGPRTRAIVPVHLFGQSAPVFDAPVAIVDDAAQAAGAAPPTPAGRVSAASCYPTKTWGAHGNAGFVLSDDAELLERVRRWTAHGMVAPHVHVADEGVVGRNARMDAIQAAILAVTAPRVAERVARRRAIAAHYDACLGDVVEPLPRGPGHPVHHYVARVPARDHVRAGLAARGVESAVYYPMSLARQPALHVWSRVETPVADALCASLIALPVHEHLTDVAVDDVVACVREVLVGVRRGP